MENIKKFIEDNSLSFLGTGSSLNGNCVVLAGYALYKEISLEDLIDYFEEIPDVAGEAFEEMERVYNYAEINNYGDWWKREDAKKSYKF